MEDAEDRCRALCYGYTLLKARGGEDALGLATDCLRRLEPAWGATDSEWRRIDLAFFVAQTLAPHEPELAKRYMTLAESTRDDALSDSGVAASGYVSCVRLGIRAFVGLIPRGIDTAEDLGRLAGLIDRIGSSIERIRLWSELALRCFVNGRTEMSQRLVTEHVRPTLNLIPAENVAHRWRAIVVAAPALFCAHRSTALEVVAGLPRPLRDEAYDSICKFLFEKQPAWEPYSYLQGDGYDLSFESAVDICEVLSLVSEDQVIYNRVSRLADSLASKRNRGRISVNQRADIADRLERIVVSKLPDQENIQHDGYKVAASAQIRRIRPVPQREWEHLLDDARRIPNLSDRAFVLCIASVAMAYKEGLRGFVWVEKGG